MRHPATHRNTLQHTATHCNPLRHTITLCRCQHLPGDTLRCASVRQPALAHEQRVSPKVQHTVIKCNTPSVHTIPVPVFRKFDINLLKTVRIIIYSVLQCVASCTARLLIRCSVLQCVAVCCSVLQRNASCTARFLLNQRDYS